MSLKTLAAAWNRFFFEPQSPLSIAVLRVFYGAFFLIWGMLLSPNILPFFSSDSIASLPTINAWNGFSRFTILNFIPVNDQVIIWMYAGLMVSALCVMLGLYTRVATITLWVLFVSFVDRNSTVFNCSEDVARTVGFFLMFAPAGEALSLDRYLAKRRDRSLGAPRMVIPWAQRMIQLQLTIVYLITFLWKVKGSTWLDGTALYYSVRLLNYMRFPVPYFFEHMWSLKLFTWGSLALEFSLCTLIWIKEFRYPLLVMGALFHLGIDYSMTVPFFGAIMGITYLSFIEPADMAVVFQKLRRKYPRLVKVAVT